MRYTIRMNSTFTKHALEKFALLERHGFSVSKEQVRGTVESPDLVIDREHVLRVVYRQEGSMKVIITFYPGRKKQYG